MSTIITDVHGRTIIPILADDGLNMIYHVNGQGQSFTQTFNAKTPEDAAIACIEAAFPSHLVPEPEPTPPSPVTRFQLMAALLLTPSPLNTNKTLFDDATEKVNQAGGSFLLAWQHADRLAPDGQLVLFLRTALSLPSHEFDEMLRTAATLNP